MGYDSNKEMTKNIITKALFTFVLSAFLSGCTNSTPILSNNSQVTNQENYIVVKYRADSVNINSPVFEHIPTSSSVVNGLWYDQANKYMIIKLNSTYYHYCGLSATEWTSFKNASSYGTYYNAKIKGNYDCRVGYVPKY